MDTKKYNGWTNYETWRVNLWFDDSFNDDARRCFDDAEADNTFTRTERATLDLADVIKDMVEEMNPITDSASLWSDLVNGALSEVNWYEIAEQYIENIDKDESEVA